MKKITFKLFAILTLLVATITNAQTSVLINNINGEPKATFLANNPTLSAGTELEIELTYTNVVDNGTNSLVARFLTSTWSEISGTLESIAIPGTAESATPQTATITITVPSISPAVSAAKIQVRGYNGTSYNNNVHSPYDIAKDDVETSASVSITSINGQTAADYYASNNFLVEGETLTIGVNYTAIKANPDEADAVQVKVRLLNDYALIPEATIATIPVTTDDGLQSTTLSLTIPNIGTDITNKARIQAVGYGFKGVGIADGLVFDYAGPTWSIDSTTLSLNKASLEGVTVDGATISFGAQHLNDTYTIFNITGQAVKSGSAASTISITSLSSGVYFLSTEKGSLKFAK